MKISIITVCYNSAATIEDTLKSVLKQNYNNYEYLIIDGKSTDDTLKIVKRYEKKFKGKMRVVSEKDKGLYDAMNKGIKLATGDIIGIINSDDVLLGSNVFSSIVENFDENTDILYGDLIYCNESLTLPVRNYISGKNSSLSWCPAHPTMYIRKSIYEKFGDYKLQYRVAADFDLMVRLNVNRCKFKYLRRYLVLMRMGGTSNGLKGYIRGFKDSCTILKDNSVNFSFIRSGIRVLNTISQYITTFFNRKKLQEILKKYNDNL